jgi:hypothetical protein
MAIEPTIYKWGPFNKRMFGSAPPSLATDGTFTAGDRITNTAPAAGGTAEWICTTSGNGATSVWKAVSIAA